MLRAMCHTDEEGWTDVVDVARISDLIAEGNLVWAQADVASLSPSDVSTIQEEFGLHPLAVEDAVSLRQRPKLEAYENHLFSVMHQLDEADGQLEASQIACFAAKQWVLTLHEHAERTIEETDRRLRRAPKPRERGPSFVMHALLDSLVDDYEAKATAIEEEVESIEEQLLVDPATPVDKQLYSIKQRLARLRRYVVPGERILSAMLGPSQTAVPDDTRAYFRDIEDHLLRIIDQMRNVQDLVDALLELRRIEQTNALSDATKRLSGWAAIIAVPTFIASVYGMNFELLPNEQEIFGFFFAVGLMLASGVFLYAYFKRRGWI
jgi:magnesium transporter